MSGFGLCLWAAAAGPLVPERLCLHADPRLRTTIMKYFYAVMTNVGYYWSTSSVTIFEPL